MIGGRGVDGKIDALLSLNRTCQSFKRTLSAHHTSSSFYRLPTPILYPQRIPFLYKQIHSGHTDFSPPPPCPSVRSFPRRNTVHDCGAAHHQPAIVLGRDRLGEGSRALLPHYSHYTSHLTPSWNASVITIKIPKNFPLNEPLLTVALLYKADPPQDQPTTLDAEKFIKVLPGSTIGELRLPGDYEDAGIGLGPTRIGGDRAMGGLPKLPAGEQMVLLSNPQNLFHPRLQDSSDTLSLRLQRSLKHLYDNSTNSGQS
ncbi:hypothetical protein C7M84_025412 [Penaeus vannamei]|uniref:Uncharacterized protein n=1 Tax=Penaeus vannamei TaxID=6689 RepID=A0A423TYA7_PENVA|nr:hypothetical protein C7M84_025412 [Penaeus vannamei]